MHTRGGSSNLVRPPAAPRPASGAAPRSVGSLAPGGHRANHVKMEPSTGRGVPDEARYGARAT